MTRGEVVLFDWAYTDGRGSKMRPAVVVQAMRKIEECLKSTLSIP
jgi:hypothetical protein